jgi:hypothetical protein
MVTGTGKKIFGQPAFQSWRSSGVNELTIVASCFWLATFLILPMMMF